MQVLKARNDFERTIFVVKEKYLANALANIFGHHYVRAFLAFFYFEQKKNSVNFFYVLPNIAQYKMHPVTQNCWVKTGVY